MPMLYIIVCAYGLCHNCCLWPVMLWSGLCLWSMSWSVLRIYIIVCAHGLCYGLCLWPILMVYAMVYANVLCYDNGLVCVYGLC